MSGLDHQEIWAAIDKLAARLGTSPSGLARLAGLDPTSFNRSKRAGAEGEGRPRWLSTESLAKVLTATGVSFAEFARLAEGERAPAKGVPLLGFAQAGEPIARNAAIAIHQCCFMLFPKLRRAP